MTVPGNGKDRLAGIYVVSFIDIYLLHIARETGLDCDTGLGGPAFVCPVGGFGIDVVEFCLLEFLSGYGPGSDKNRCSLVFSGGGIKGGFGFQCLISL